MNRDAARLKELLRTQSLKIGDFVLASGKRSRYYFDSKLTTLTAEGAFLTAKCFLSLIRAKRIKADAIGGMTIGADPIVSAVAALSGSQTGLNPLNAFIIRKEAKSHGTMKWVEGPVTRGQSVIIVDDVVTTGKSTLTAIEKAEHFGLKVVAVIVLVDREEGGGDEIEKKYKYIPFARRSEIFHGSVAYGEDTSSSRLASGQQRPLTSPAP